MKNNETKEQIAIEIYKEIATMLDAYSFEHNDELTHEVVDNLIFKIEQEVAYLEALQN